jgi:N-acetylglutamate synthase-like GNAT family acetyltransferase
MPEFQIRTAQRQDLPRLLALYTHLHEDEPLLKVDRRVAGLWDEIMANPWLCYVMGEVDEELVSSCTLTLVPNLTRGARPYGLIENVVTHPDQRKKGYATAVLRHALQVAWNHGCYKVMLLTGSKKEETLRFYENAGFKRGVKTGFIAYPETGG